MKGQSQNWGCFGSVMAEWLEQASQWHEEYCHDLEVVSSNPSRVEIGVHSTSVPSHTWTKHFFTTVQIAQVAQLTWIALAGKRG